MGKLINLDKFKEIQKVMLDGNEYEVRGLNVGEFLDGNILEAVEKADGMKNQVKEMLIVLSKFTNIPGKILLKQQFSVLMALIQVMQGADPDETGDENDPKKKP